MTAPTCCYTDANGTSCRCRMRADAEAALTTAQKDAEKARRFTKIARDEAAKWAGRAIAARASLAEKQFGEMDISSAVSFLLMVENADAIADAAQEYKIPMMTLRSALAALSSATPEIRHNGQSATGRDPAT